MTRGWPSDATARARSWAGDPTGWIVAAALVAGCVVAFRSRGSMVDDAGILGRYAERIAAGDGWTYNDGDRTNGASAALYTMLLAAASLVGVDVLDAARAIGILAAGACAALVAHVGGRVSGLVAAVVGPLLLITWVYFQQQATSGMESALAAALGMAVVAALLHDRDTLAGVLLGLALLNKLDAGLLAVAVAIAVLVVRRRPPWRIAAISAAIVAPWLLFSTLYFGSPLPHSFTQKASGTTVNPAYVVDRTWVLDHLWETDAALIAVLALGALVLVPGWVTDRAPAAVAVTTAVVWPIAHGLAFSVLDLGDGYSWYLVVLCPPIALAAGITLGELARRITPRWLGPAVVVGVVVLAVVVPVDDSPLERTVRTVVRGGSPTGTEPLERARVAAGIRLGELADDGDVVVTCYGWIAYYAPQTTIEETCPLNTRDPVGPPRWLVTANGAGTEPADVPVGPVLVESVVVEAAPGAPGARVDIYRVDPP